MKITGTIVDTRKQPLSGYWVTVSHGDVDLPKEKVLRRGHTDRAGHYSLPIDIAGYPRGANIRVAVLGKGGTKLWSSEIFYNVTSDLTIDGEIPDSALGITEFGRLVDTIESRVELAKLLQLTPTQRAYLSGSTGVADSDLARLVSALLMHEALPAISTETFFGMQGSGLPGAVESLLTLDEASWRDAVAAAMNGNVIRRLSAKTINHVVASLAARKASIETRAPSSPAADGAAAIAAAFTPSKAMRNRVASLITRHDGLNGAVFEDLRRSGMTDKQEARLKNVVDAYDVLGQDPQLLNQVAAHLRRRGQTVAPAALASIDHSAWQSLVDKAARKRRADAPGAGQQPARSAETAGTIAAQVAWRYPTQLLAAQISSAPSKGYFGKHKKELSNFFQRHPNFDIRTGLVEMLPLGSPSDPGAADEHPVQERVKTLARLYRALPEAHAPAAADAAGDSAGVFERLSALADSEHRYRSSFDVARQPRAAFAKGLARSKADVAYWERVHDQATAMSDITSFMLVSLLQRSRMSTYVTKGLFKPEDEVTREENKGKKAKKGTKQSREPGVADLRTLFGSLDRCQCEHCASVTSPASYLADTLNFLHVDVAPSGAKAPYDVLVEQRRPDIPHLLLNCDNTNVELPYIDLVNELLEDEVLRQNGVSPIWSPYHNVTLNGSLAAILTIAARSDSSLSTLAKRVIAFALNAVLPDYRFDADLQVSVKHRRDDGSSDRWFVFDKGRLLELAYEGPSVGANGTSDLRQVEELLKKYAESFLSNPTVQQSDSVANLTNLKNWSDEPSNSITIEYISRQTYGTSEELRANPLFRNERVSELLEAEEFPPSLPPGLPLLEARLFLEHLKQPREQLIRQLTPGEVGTWAVEYLGLSAADTDQLGLIGGPGSWGFAAHDAVVDPADTTKLLKGPWIELLRRVDVLIARARISYIDLLELLGAESVNPTPRATIVSVEASDACDLSKLRIQLNEKHFSKVRERMRRFLRLQRRVGWKTWELDLALRQLNVDLLSTDKPKVPGSSVANQLVPLAILKKVKAELHLGHADACALMGGIDRARRIDHRADGQPAVPSQYEALLLNRAVTNPVDGRFLLTDDRSALSSPVKAGEGLATLAAAFQVDASDIALILEQIKVGLKDELTLDLISKIYRRVLFARGFGISVRELVWIERLNGGLPGIPQCLEFVDRVKVLLRSPLSVTEAWYLLAGEDASTAYLVPGDDEIGQQLDQIREQLVKIEANHVVPGPPDTDGAELRRILSELDFGAPLTDDLIGAVTDTKLFSVDVLLPDAAVNALDPANGVKFALPRRATFLQKRDVMPLVRYRAEDGVLLALHPLTRSDRATLLRATENNDFRGAVEALYALGKLTYEDGRLTCRGLLPAASVKVVEKRVNNPLFTKALDAIVEQQTQLLTRKLAYGGLAKYEFPLQSARPLTIPAELQPYAYLDQVKNVLVVRGQLTELELHALTAESTIPGPLLTALRNGPLPAKVNDVPAFLSAADVGKIFDPRIAPDMPTTTADISRELLVEYKLMAYASDVLKRKVIVTALGNALGLADGVTAYLLRNLGSAMRGSSIADAFAALGVHGERTDPAPYQLDYRRLSKISLLFQRLKIQEVHLPWMFRYPTANWLSVPSLQVGAARVGTGLAKLTELVRMIAIAGQSPYSPQLLDQILVLADRMLALAAEAMNASPTAFTPDPLRGMLKLLVRRILKLLADKSGWKEDDLLKVFSTLGLSSASRFLEAQTFERLRDAMKGLTRLGATVDQALQLTAREIDDDAAIVAKSLAKAKHTAADWLKVVEPISNIVREARRAALVDYLVTHPRHAENKKTREPLWHDVDTLYEYLLVDVQMGACMKTTRIRLALSSVQLFVQRCLMNLEPAVSIGNDLQIRRRWDEWDSWRKLYRVWEANRKVFLYPEDWMDPALRDDKTPFFQELENELQQAEVTNETAEAAIRNYLQKLDQVSKLEVMGIFIEGDRFEAPKTGRDLRVLHVVARTYGEPNEWFYRTLTTTRPNDWHQGVWSPWERIDTDVEGEHVLPVVWNGHVYLFWALFEQKADRRTSNELNDTSKVHDSKDRWYIRFARSERRNGKWLPKRLSKEALRTPCVESGDRRIMAEDFSFRTDVTNDRIQVHCFGPVASQFSSGGTSGAAAAEQPPLYEGSSKVVIEFMDPTTGVRRTDIDITVYYDDGKKQFTESGRAVGGRFELWKRVGSYDRISIRTTPSVTKHHPLPLALLEPTPGIVRLIYTVYTIQIDAGTSPTVAEMASIGRFNFDVCRGDLVPFAGAMPVGQWKWRGTTRRGMMLVENEDPVTGSASQPFLDLLKKTPSGRYRVLFPHRFSSQTDAYFFQTDHDVFLVTLTWGKGWRFNVFYHPFTCDFITTAAREGVAKLLTLKSQLTNDRGQHFADRYGPDWTQVQQNELDEDKQPVAVTREHVDFSSAGAYGIYNWELFFHIPWLIATRLQANQRFEEARKWFHYIFDPTSRPGADAPLTELKPTQRFWNVLPFWKAEGREDVSIDDLLGGAAGLSEAFRQWREDPFKPFVVGRMRQSAFMLSIVLTYIDNLIDWGDQQFARFTAESTNEATLLYVLASQILGRAPEKIPPRVRPTLQTYQSLQEDASSGASPIPTWQNFSDVLVEIETFVPPSAAIADADTSSPLGRMWAFCVPPNGKLLEAWPRVAQRLFNLRHCRDLDGVERSFPIWDPEIDPDLLVRAAAAGVDLASVLGDINAATPHYRFTVMLQKAVELCNEVKNFGAALLSAIEKKEGEALALLRSQQEIGLLEAIKIVRDKQVQESKTLREAANKSRLTVEARRDYYRDIPQYLPQEVASMVLTGQVLVQETIASVSDVLAAALASAPQYHMGTSGTYGSPVAVTEYGGEQLSRSASAWASAARSIGSGFSTMAGMLQTGAGYERRWREWKLQETLANKELDQIEKQIIAAEIREQIAQAELENHDKQIDNTKTVHEYLKGKYTNEQLHGWMQGQLASLYFQAYKLAFSMAKKAERAFGHELGVFDTRYIQFGYWDSLKKGLLAGERLQSDLRRMEAAYLEQNAREYEITKHVSLTALDPRAIILLKATGACEVELPEWLFDMDHAGHRMRRIKSLALSIPCVTGPYTSVNCTLTQLSSKVRLADGDIGDYGSASNFHEYFGSAQAIVTSNGREDSGLFEVNFRDERYLPFEGTGAISKWRIELPIESNQFDRWTVSDVIFHIRYTARPGSDDLRAAATSQIPFKGARMFSLRQEFPSEWSQMTTSKGAASAGSSEVSLSRDRFPFFFTTKDRRLSIKAVSLYALPSDDATEPTFPDSLKVYLSPSSNKSALDGASDASIGQLPGKTFKANVDLSSASDAARWTFGVTDPAAFKRNVTDVLIVCQYEVAPDNN